MLVKNAMQQKTYFTVSLHIRAAAAFIAAQEGALSLES